MPETNFPTYPPYHRGKYLEEFFCHEFRNNVPQSKRIFIPVHWTNCYKLFNDKPVPGLQDAIDDLDSSYNYFIVATHDDAPRENLPEGTVCYVAGGNQRGVPIPLVCSTIKNPIIRKRDIFASFVGAVTHPIRLQIAQALRSNDKYQFTLKEWHPHISQSEEMNFKETMERSEFSLCPRGYGTTSYRLYEAMQLGSIPVYISDRFWLPWEDEINWNEFCIRIPQSRICEMDFILSSIPEKHKEHMRKKMKKVYNEFFTIPKITRKILKEVKK